MPIIDDNRGEVAMAVTDDAAAILTALRVSPVNSRLLIEVAYVATTTPATLTMKTDDNKEGVAMIVTDDADETPTPLIIDNRNGLLWVDLLIE